ncbi:MAG: D-mannonate epimerase, partial [Spirochaetales bacterium]|nr:D-mannonate epimerase [Spirochaetales bacterium]
GMERIMGRADNPVRAVVNYAAREFLRSVPVIFILTVVGRRPPGPDGREAGLAVRGLFAGRGFDCFYRAAELALETNLTVIDEEPTHVVARLDPDEFHSTWLGNKAIYRTRMMIADGGRLTVLAPGVESFGEDAGIDRLVRKHGYRGTPETLRAVERDAELADNLGAAAHLIHGSSEGRFDIEYAPGKLTREEIEGVGFEYRDLADVTEQLAVDTLIDGWNTLPSGERIYYISQPALGLWAFKKRF